MNGKIINIPRAMFERRNKFYIYKQKWFVVQNEVYKIL